MLCLSNVTVCGLYICQWMLVSQLMQRPQETRATNHSTQLYTRCSALYVGWWGRRQLSIWSYRFGCNSVHIISMNICASSSVYITETSSARLLYARRSSQSAVYNTLRQFCLSLRLSVCLSVTLVTWLMPCCCQWNTSHRPFLSI